MAGAIAKTRTRMTRRDFELIAACVRTTRIKAADNPELIATVRDVAEELADALGCVHPGFDHDRFLTACGVST